MTTTKYYAFGGARIAVRQNGVLSYLHSDHLGSTSVVTNAGGATTNNVRYFAYGGQRGTGSIFALPTDHAFTGQKLDRGTGLLCYGARYYDSALGMFVSPDTIIPNPGNPQDLNRYAYVRNNPLRYRDPSGHWAETAWDLINIGWDIAEVAAAPTPLNIAALVVDVAAAVLPGVPAGAGLVVRGGKAAKVAVEAASHADEAGDVARIVAEAASHADEAKDALRAAEQTVNAVRGVESATQAAKGASELPRRFSRYMSRSELEAVQETGLLRSGRPGDSYFTTNKFRTVRSAEEKLALPRSPEVRLDFEITGQPTIYGPRKVAPAFGKPGGGIEYWSPDPVRVRIIRWRDLK